MKKITLLFGAALLALTSCSKNDNSAPAAATAAADTSVLVKTESSGTNSTIYTYNGNHIVSYNTSGHSSSYTYTGDLITSVTNTNINTTSKSDYTYDVNGKLATEVYSSDTGKGTVLNPSYKNNFTYNTDGSVTAQNSFYSNGAYTASGTTKYTFTNGNLVKKEHFDTKGVSDEVTVNEFDSKNSPFQNIMGFPNTFPLLRLYALGGVSNKNNITKSTHTSGGSTTYVYTYVYTYNDKGFPLTIQATYVSGTQTPEVYNYVYTY